MFKIDQAKNLFNCEQCNQLLVDPVTLPCGYSVCKRRLDRLLENSQKNLINLNVNYVRKSITYQEKVLPLTEEFRMDWASNLILWNWIQFLRSAQRKSMMLKITLRRLKISRKILNTLYLNILKSWIEKWTFEERSRSWNLTNVRMRLYNPLSVLRKIVSIWIKNPRGWVHRLKSQKRNWLS